MINSISNSDETYKTILILIDLAHIDGELSDTEKLWIMNLIDLSPLNTHQKSNLRSEIQTPSYQHRKLFNQIESFSARSKALHLIRHLNTKDGKLTQQEKDAFKKLKYVHEVLSIKSQEYKDYKKNIMKQKVVHNFLNSTQTEKEISEDLKLIGKTLGMKRYGFLETINSSSYIPYFLANLWKGNKYSKRFASLIVIYLVLLSLLVGYFRSR